jgi:SOUL heme-binding protein
MGSACKYWNEDPWFGCQAGSKYRIVHAKQDQAHPIHFSSSAPVRRQDVDSLPVPADAAVQRVRVPGGVFAAVSFGGVADEAAMAGRACDLLRAIEADGLAVAEEAGGSSAYLAARYNGPSTPAAFRRNEVLVRLQDWRLW